MEQNLALIDAFIKYKEMFGWSPNDMSGINTDIISHKMKNLSHDKADRIKVDDSSKGWKIAKCSVRGRGTSSYMGC